MNSTMQLTAEEIIANANRLRWQIGSDFHERVVEATFTEAANLADSVVTRPDRQARPTLDKTIDRLVTSRMWGLPIMFLLFALVFWITITGANVPSKMLDSLLIGQVSPGLHQVADAIRLPWWLSGLLLDGMYLATAWVVAVMLPPMAIFFPLFTLLEDFGYLPRVAFNLDNIFKKSGAHGKQALSMMMGFGCNAAGRVPAGRNAGPADAGFWPGGDRHRLHRRTGARLSRRHHLCAGGDGSRHPGCSVHVCRVVEPLAHRAQGPGLHLQPGVGALSPAAYPANAVHFDD